MEADCGSQGAYRRAARVAVVEVAAGGAHILLLRGGGEVGGVEFHCPPRVDLVAREQVVALEAARELIEVTAEATSVKLA